MFLSQELTAVPDIPKDVMILDALKPATVKTDAHGKDVPCQRLRRNVYVTETVVGNNGLNIGRPKLQESTEYFYIWHCNTHHKTYGC